MVRVGHQSAQLGGPSGSIVDSIPIKRPWPAPYSPRPIGGQPRVLWGDSIKEEVDMLAGELFGEAAGAVSDDINPVLYADVADVNGIAHGRGRSRRCG